MKIAPECIPCLVRQAFEAVRLATDDQERGRRILRQVLFRLANEPFDKAPPSVGADIHRIVRLMAAETDPYLEIKRHSNSLAMRLMPTLRELVSSSGDRFETAVRLAICGNVIDCAQGDNVGEQGVKEAVFRCLDQPVNKNAINELKDEARSASSILYLGDNAGEVFFDRLLIEELAGYPVKFVVRGAPIINDALREDAEGAGLDKLVTVIDNGSDAPGTILDECSEEFKTQFREADLVVAKGQGNYHTLRDQAKSIFYLLKVKCPVIANEFGCDEGDMVVVRRG